MKQTKQPDHGAWWLGVTLLAVLALFSGCSGGLKFPTEYQAVLLDNGQVYFGKVSDAGSSDTASAYILLEDVYYIQRVEEAGKKEVKNILIKRGNELHRPEFMRINSRHVVLIEPVSPDSRVAQLIREANAPWVPAPPAAAPPTGAPAAVAPPAPAPAPQPAPAPAATKDEKRGPAPK